MRTAIVIAAVIIAHAVNPKFFEMGVPYSIGVLLGMGITFILSIDILDFLIATNKFEGIR